MKCYNIRIALESDIKDARLKKLLGRKYVVNVNHLKGTLRSLSCRGNCFEYALIIHDRDGTCNKPHLHLVVVCDDYARYFLSTRYFLIGYFEECRSYEASLLYLLHCGHADKKQYGVSDLYTNIDYYARFPFLKGVC